MVRVTHIEQYGNQFKAYLDDATVQLLYPTQGTIWTTRNSGDTGGGGGGGEFSYPYPLDYVTSEFGPRSGRFHEGMDWSGGPATSGQPIPAIGDAVVHNVFSNSGYGNCVDLFHGTFGGYDWYSRYAHMSTTAVVSEGASITKGTTVGPIGNTGNSFGAHLHLEIHRAPIGGNIVNDNNNPSWASGRTAINPRSFFDAYGDGGVIIP